MKIAVGSFVLMSILCLSFSQQSNGLVYPNHFPEPSYNFKKNPTSESKRELGRALFYDPILSLVGTISCASCHSPYNSFAHTDHDLSHGINDQIGTRNAPALFNLAWQKTFMWDGAINHLDVQALAPITHASEMGETLENVINKLQESLIYPELFKSAFGDSVITSERMLKSLSQFQLSLVSANSKYDQMRGGRIQFSEQEEMGYEIFKSNCNSCHKEPMFTNYSFENNGLIVDPTLNDFGRWAITKNPLDSLKFKVPSLRNLSYTYPYMHDGRFRNLKEVVNHYTNEINSNKKVNKTLSEELLSPIKLNSNEQKDLIAFLLTLNDQSFVFNTKVHFPKEILLQSEGINK